ncbi:MAG: outer membrane protein assembly factor BamD [Planctomycetota bacterium]
MFAAVAVCGCAGPRSAYVDAGSRYDRATKLAAEGRHLAAARALERFATDFPHDQKAHVAQYESGVQYEAAGEPEAAFEAFRALRRTFEYSWLVPRANARCLKLGRELLDSGDELGVTVLDHVIASGRHSDLAVQAHLALAEYAYDQARFADAQREFAAVSVEYPEHEKALYAEFRAALCAYRRIGGPGRNMRHLREARLRFGKLRASDLGIREQELADRYLEAVGELGAQRHLEMARFYFKQGLVSPARAHLAEVLRRYPDAGAWADAAQEVIELIQNEYNKEEP